MFINSKSYSNHHKSCINVQQKYRKDVVLVAFFCFAYLKVKAPNIECYPIDANRAHPNNAYVRKQLHLNAEQSSMFIF